MTRGWGLLGFAVAIATAASIGCGGADVAPRAPVPVRVVVLQQQDGVGGIRYSASVEPKIQVDVAFEVEGYVDSILEVPGVDGQPRRLQPGDRVEPGLELASIGAGEYKDRVDEAKARVTRADAALRKATAEFERDKRLFETQSITAPKYERAQKDYTSAQAEVSEARASLDRNQLKLDSTSVKAPMAGVVLARDIEVGAYVRPGSNAFSLGDVSSVIVAFGVPDTEVGKLQEGSPIDVTTASAPDRIFAGTITSIAPSAEDRTRVFEIQVTLPNDDGALRPGMIASLATGDGAAVDASVGLAVPIGSVLRSQTSPDGYAVAVVEGDAESAVASLREVELGELLGDTVAVRGGLEAGQRVIVRGAKQVTEGARVRVIP